MTTFYICAFHSGGGEILGNLDGQTIIRANSYRRTKHYKHLKGNAQAGWPRWSIPAYWEVSTNTGQVVETIKNTYRKEPT